MAEDVKKDQIKDKEATKEKTKLGDEALDDVSGGWERPRANQAPPKTVEIV